MLFSTPTQWVVVALCLVAGWLFGLASHPGGAKWKARYLAERDAHATNRKQAEASIAAARTGDSQAIADLKARNADLDRENARLRSATPVTAATIAPRPLAAARPAYPAGERRGWFDWKKPSSLCGKREAVNAAQPVPQPVVRSAHGTGWR